MAVRFIFGRAGTGKTHHCLSAIAAALEADDAGKLILLTPEQGSFEMERALAARCGRGGFIRAQVLTFSRLARQILDAGGRSDALLTPQQRRLGLHALIVQQPRSFAGFGAAAGTPGFAEQLDRALQELMSEDVAPAALRDAANAPVEGESAPDGTGGKRLVALADAYEAYLAWLGPQRIDPTLAQRRVRALLPQLEWVAGARVWVDGFAGFTAQETATLVALARCVREVEITLLIDPGADPASVGPLDPFHRTASTCGRLRTALRHAGAEEREPLRLTPANAPRFGHADLALLERDFTAPRRSGSAPPPASGGGAGAASAAPGIAVLDCATQREEWRRAARWIRRRLLEDPGLRLRDFAVIARDLEPYAGLAAEAFGEYELPYFLDRRRSLAGHALARLIASVFDAVARDFHPQAAAALLRTGLVGHLPRAEADHLEELILRCEVRGRRLWAEAQWPFAARGRSTGQVGDDSQPPEREVAAYAPARAAIVEALDPLHDCAQERATGAEWARALYETLRALGVERRLQQWIEQARQAGRHEAAEIHRQAWGTVCTLLDDVAALGSTPFALGALAGLLRAVLRSANVGLAPPTLDQVLIGSIERSRHPDVRYVWVIGFNDGLFPRRTSELPLLGPGDRAALAHAAPGLADRENEPFHERLLAYIACTRASHGLVLSFARSSSAGEVLQPSPLLDLVRAAAPRVAEREAQPDLPPVSPRDFAQAYLQSRQTAAPAQTQANLERLRSVVASDLFSAGAVTPLLWGLGFRNEPEARVADLDPPRDAPAGVAWTGSPSRIERFLRCPFQYFAEDVLRLRDRRRPDRFVLERGRVIHDVLAGVTARVIADGRPAAKLSDEDWDAHLAAAIADWRKQAERDAARRPIVSFLVRALEGPLRELVLAHATRYRASGCEPSAAELGFGRPQTDSADGAGDGPLLEIELSDGGRARLHGKIDRIDVLPDGERSRAIVYDYKTSAFLSLKNAQTLSGDLLQLMLYFAAIERGAAGPGLEPAGAFIAPLFVDRTKVRETAAPDRTSPGFRALLFRPAGLVDVTVAKRLAGPVPQGESSPVFQYQLTTRGQPYANAHVADRTRLRTLAEQAIATARMLIEGIVAGDVSVSPLVEGNRLPCQYCSHRAVCRFELLTDAVRRPEQVLPRAEAPAGADDGPDGDADEGGE